MCLLRDRQEISKYQFIRSNLDCQGIGYRNFWRSSEKIHSSLKTLVNLSKIIAQLFQSYMRRYYHRLYLQKKKSVTYKIQQVFLSSLVRIADDDIKKKN